MTRVALVLAAMIGLNWFAAAAAARDVLPVRLEQVPAGSDDLELHIAGEVTGSLARTVVLRVDDGRSSDYGSRVNDERKLPPGPFSWTVRLDQLLTSNKRPIDPRGIRQILLFDNENSEQVQFVFNRRRNQRTTAPTSMRPSSLRARSCRNNSISRLDHQGFLE